MSAHLFQNGYNIVAAQQYGEPDSRQFFMRIVFEALEPTGVTDIAALRAAASRAAKRKGSALHP